MNRYENGKIYKIVDVGYNKCYIGSTTEPLSKRMERHKGKYKSYLKGMTEHTRSFHIFDEFGVDNCKIELLEVYPTNSKEELLKREGHHIKNNQCVNKQVAGRSHKEYYLDNKEDCLRKNREYNQKNKEKVAERVKAYSEANREEIAQYKKQYREDNKEQINHYMKEYYKKHKDKINERNSNTYTCDCGIVLRKDGKYKHLKTRNHLDKILQIENK